MSNQIRVMPDHCSTGLWDGRGCNIEVPDTVSDITKAVLEAWQYVYDAHALDVNLEDSKQYDALGQAITCLLNASDADANNVYTYWKDFPNGRIIK